jgi:hypothetical protein
MELITDNTANNANTDDISTINDWTIIPNNPIQQNTRFNVKNMEKLQISTIIQSPALPLPPPPPPPQISLSKLNKIINNAYKHNNNYGFKNILAKKMLFF